jgi:hypothetical protein
VIKVLQTSALPLGHVARNKAGRLAACRLLERATRFELVAFSLARRRSTTELCPQRELLQLYQLLIHLAKIFYQTIMKTICQDPGSNWGHLHFQCSALPTELSRLVRTLLKAREFYPMPVGLSRVRRRVKGWRERVGKNGLWLRSAGSLYNDEAFFPDSINELDHKTYVREPHAIRKNWSR